MRDNGLSLKIDYCRYPNCPADPSSETVIGLDEFKKELNSDYIAVIHKHLVGRGGGVYNFAIEILTSVHLSDVVKWLAQGIAFDLLKSGTNAFVLKPFLTAFVKLRSQIQLDTDQRVDVGNLKIIFQDSIVVIEKVGESSPIDHLEKILSALAKHYDGFMLQSGAMPFEIHVPVFEDPSHEKLSKFRGRLHVDETIFNMTAADYFKFWGLRYDISSGLHKRVYDVSRALLIDENFYTDREYWTAWDQKRKYGKANSSP